MKNPSLIFFAYTGERHKLMFGRGIINYIIALLKK